MGYCRTNFIMCLRTCIRFFVRDGLGSFCAAYQSNRIAFASLWPGWFGSLAAFCMDGRARYSTALSVNFVLFLPAMLGCLSSMAVLSSSETKSKKPPTGANNEWLLGSGTWNRKNYTPIFKIKSRPWWVCLGDSRATRFTGLRVDCEIISHLG